MSQSAIKPAINERKGTEHKKKKALHICSWWKWCTKTITWQGGYKPLSCIFAPFWKPYSSKFTSGGTNDGKKILGITEEKEKGVKQYKSSKNT